MSPWGPGSQGGQAWEGAGGAGSVGQHPTQEQGDRPLGRGRLLLALHFTVGREDTTGLAKSHGKGVSRSSRREAGSV